MHRRRRIWLLVSTVLLLVASTLAGIAVTRSAAQQFQQARQRWEARPFARYQLVLERRFPQLEAGRRDTTCRQTVEVVDERVTRVIASNCAQVLTVGDIFQRFEPYTRRQTAVRRCDGGGCICAASSLTAMYHPQLGYPQHIERTWHDLDSAAGRHWRDFASRLPVPAQNLADRIGLFRPACMPAAGAPLRWVPAAAYEEITVVALVPQATQ